MRLQHELAKNPPAFDKTVDYTVIADALGWPAFKVSRLLRWFATEHISLDTPLANHDDLTFGDVVSDDHADPLRNVIPLLVQPLRAWLRKLTAKERRVIEMRFGIDEQSPHSLTSIAAELNYSITRVKQLEQAAMAKLRRRCQKVTSRHLSSYMEVRD
jgi:DNA-directed RNA polymerase sigma subunit (sigma70/sigma32)